MRFKGRDIHPYESFYCNTTQKFSRGQLGGGIARCVKTDNSLATMVEMNEPQILRKFRTEEQRIHRKITKGMDEHFSGREMRPATDGVSNTLTSVQKDNYLAIPEATAQGYAEAHEGDSVNLAVPNSNTRRGRVGKQIANTLDTGCQQGVVEPSYRIRKLTPRECFRLMGVDDADIDKIQASGISNSQQYKCAGNSIVVDVLYHLFRKMFVETDNEQAQGVLF